ATAQGQGQGPRQNSGPHNFEKIRSRKGTTGAGSGQGPGAGGGGGEQCAACLGLWDGGGATKSRFYRCTRCCMMVHGACRQFFQASELCQGQGQRRSGEGGAASHGGWRGVVRNRAGVVQVGVLQVYKLPLAPGEGVYAALRLLPWRERVRTGSAVWGEMGAVWPGDPGGRHALIHPYNSESSPLPTLRVEVWRSAMRVLDEMLG
ncbi:unnamed protein product, partial [Discosporangium mesarthrocarpum]